MKKVLGAALMLSLMGNLYLGFLLIKQEDKIDAGVHAELLAIWGLQDLAYLLRHSGMTKGRLLELARKQPAKPNNERVPPELTGNRVVWWPLEVTFTGADAIDQIKVAGDAY